MTDRELLEAAAKAEGHGVELDPASGLTFLDNKFTGMLWDPLHNDGDALRLAVKLDLTVMIGAVRDVSGQLFLDKSEDDLEATRRAIVRAAAAIGKEMKDD
jgi:hypothetical protein